MTFQTKLILSDDKFQQPSGNTLTFNGVVLLNNSNVISGNSIVNADYVVSAITSNAITSASNGITDLSGVVSLGGTLINPTSIATTSVNRLTFTGFPIEYGSNLTTDFTERSLVDKAYVDAIASGLDAKASVRLATTSSDANLDLTGGTFSAGSIDGVTLNDGDRVLIKNQNTNPEQNGLYVYSASTSGFTRSEDADGSPANEVTAGLFTFVEDGVINADFGYTLATNDPITVGTTPLEFVKFSHAGNLSFNNGLTQNGDTVSLGGTLTGNTIIDANTSDFTVDAGTITNGTTLLRADIGASTNEPLIRFKNQAGNNVASGFVDINIGTCNINQSSGAWGNIAIGQNNLTNLNATGDFAGGRNIALGYNVGGSLTTGNNNVLMGRNVLTTSTTSSYNVVAGYGAASITTTPFKSAVILGLSAARSLNNGKVTDSCFHTMIGGYAGVNATCISNVQTFIGVSVACGLSTASGSQVLIGDFTASNAVNLGCANTIIGASAASSIRDSIRNTIIGGSAGEFSSGATCSIFIGNCAGWSMGGSSNSAVGFRAGRATNATVSTRGTLFTGSKVTFIGSSNTFDITTPNISDTISIGNDYAATGSNRVILASKGQVELIANHNADVAKASMTSSGLYYDEDFSATGGTNPRWIPDVDYVTGLTNIFNNGLTETGGTVSLGGTLTGDTSIESATFTFSIGEGITITGSSAFASGKATKALANFATAIGYYAYACGVASSAEGFYTQTFGYASHSEGGQTCAVGKYAHSEGGSTRAIGYASHSEGRNAYAYGCMAHAQGRITRACGDGSHAGGNGSGFKPITALGYGSFAHSNNDGSQTTGHGALAAGSAILGGLNHNIESGNTRAAIIGGNAIKLTGTTYIDHTAMSNLAIMSTPTTGTSGDTVLVRDSSTGIIKEITQSTLVGGSIAVDNGLSKASDGTVVLGGTLTGNTVISASTFSIAIGSGACATGNTSFAVGRNTKAFGIFSNASGYGSCASGDYSQAHGFYAYATGATGFAIGTSTMAGGYASFAAGISTRALGQGSHAEGTNTFACGFYSHAEGTNTTCADGNGAHGEGQATRAFGDASHSEGCGTRACANFSHAEGRGSWAIGVTSHAEGTGTRAIGQDSHSEGAGTCAVGYASHAEGVSTCAVGNYSHAQGHCTIASGNSSQSSGIGYSSDKYICAFGLGSFIHSQNTVGQIAGHGALANQSAILGGINHNIESGNTRAAIIGGNAIKLTGTTYIDHTAVANLAIMSSPSTGASGDTVLVRDSSTGIIKQVSQNSLVDSSIGADNGLSVNGNGDIVLGGSLTGNTIIDTNDFGIAIGKNSNATGTNSFSVGRFTYATTGDSFALGFSACAFGQCSGALNSGVATGNGALSVNVSCADGLESFAANRGRAYGQRSVAIGNSTRAYGVNSFAGGAGCSFRRVISCGDFSFNFSTQNGSADFFEGVHAQSASILGGLNHNIESGNTRAAIIGGYNINLTGTTYIDHTAVSNLAIMSSPTGGTTSDSVLVRDASTGIIKEVTQASLVSGSISVDNGLSIAGDGDIVLGGTLTGDTAILTGNNGFLVGYGQATGSDSVSLAGGYAYGANSLAGVGGGIANGACSVALGATTACGIGSVALGRSGTAFSNDSFVMGANGVCGIRSIGLGGSSNTTYAADSAIIVSTNSSISSGNTNAVLLGVNSVSLTGTSYINHTAVANLAIMSSPTAGTSSDSVLVRDASTGIIKEVTQASIGGAAGTVNNILDITGVTSFTANTSNHVLLVDTSGGVQTITLPASPTDGLTYKIKDKGNALTNNITIDGNGNNIDNGSSATISTDYGAFEFVYSEADGQWYTLSFVN